MITYLMLTVYLHGLSLKTVEEGKRLVDNVLRPIFGQRLDGDVEIDVEESAGHEEPTTT